MAAENRRIAEVGGALLFSFGLAILVPTLGCAGGDSPSASVSDGDGARSAPEDAGSAIDAGPFPPPATGEAARTDVSGLAGSGCWDNLDGDGDWRVDCADDECDTQPLCCVGSSNAACCRAAATATRDFTACADLTTCAPDAAAFGAGPDVSSGALVPMGSLDYDGGLVFPAPIELGVLRARLEGWVRAGTGCTACLDQVGFGLAPSAALYDARARVVPYAALVVNAGEQAMRLLVGSAVIWEMSLAEAWSRAGVAPGDPIQLALETAPDGTLSIELAGVQVATGIAYAPGLARAVIYGRTSNPGSTVLPAGVTQLTIATSVCDVPAALVRGPASILPDGVDAWWRTPRVGAPSVVAWDEPAPGPSTIRREAMLFAYEGRIHRAGGVGGGRFRAPSDPGDPTSAVLRPETDAFRMGSVGDPELVRGADAWTVFFTATDAAGTSTIGQAIGGAAFDWQRWTVAQLLGLDAPGGSPGTTLGLDGPSHLVTAAGELLAVRRRYVDPSGAPRSEILIYDLPTLSVAGVSRATEAPGAGTVASPAVHQAGLVPGRFDADEIAAPELFESRGVLRLYFAGRRSTRWSIGVLLSPDGHTWEVGNGGAPLLVGSGAGFDALSVGDPAVLAGDGSLRLYYTGSDGAQQAIGLASQPVAP